MLYFKKRGDLFIRKQSFKKTDWGNDFYIRRNFIPEYDVPSSLL